MTENFRPHIRDYLFRMMQAGVLENDNPKWFPSPIGDYFFYLMRFSNRTSTVGYMFPSPYWGLFFYPYAL